MRANFHLARSKNALDFEKNLENSKEYANHQSQLISFRNNSNHDSSALISLAKDNSIDPDAYIAAIELLNWWERGANGIRCKVYRDDVLHKVYCSHLINLANYLEPFIIQKRIERKNQYIFIEIIWLKKRRERKRKYQNFLTTLIDYQVALIVPLLLITFSTSLH